MATTNSQTTVAYTSTNHPIYTTFQAKNFLTDPVFNYLLVNTPWYHKAAATYHILRLQLHGAAHSNRALYVSASAPSTTQSTISPTDAELNPQCNAIILPPGKGGVFDIGATGWSGLILRRGLHKVFWYAGTKPWKEFWTQMVVPNERAKAYTFSSSSDYYYVAFISTALDHRGKGLAQSLLSDLQGRAQEEGKPIWLEASSPASRRVYAKCGFLDVGVDGEESVGKGFRMGVGEVDECGERCVGVEAVGVPLWPMVWWPEGYGKGGNRV